MFPRLGRVEIAVLAFVLVGATGIGSYLASAELGRRTALAGLAPPLATGSSRAPLPIRERGEERQIGLNIQQPAADSSDSGADSQNSCASERAVYASIAQTTQGADMDEVVAALAALDSDPLGLAGEAESPLAARLRDASGLTANKVQCGGLRKFPPATVATMTTMSAAAAAMCGRRTFPRTRRKMTAATRTTAATTNPNRAG
jgi:hypothetical protein